MISRPGTQALVVSRADKIVISASLASSRVRNNIWPSFLQFVDVLSGLFLICIKALQFHFNIYGIEFSFLFISALQEQCLVYSMCALPFVTSI